MQRGFLPEEQLGHAQRVDQVNVVNGEALLFILDQRVLVQTVDRAGFAVGVDHIQYENMIEVFEGIEYILRERAAFTDGDLFRPVFLQQLLRGENAHAVVRQQHVANAEYQQSFHENLMGNGAVPGTLGERHGPDPCRPAVFAAMETFFKLFLLRGERASHRKRGLFAGGDSRNRRSGWRTGNLIGRREN